MIYTTNSAHANALNKTVRQLQARVDIYEGSTLSLSCGCHDNLKSFTVERLGEEGKFFGFGVCQKLKLVLMDVDRSINISTANSIKVIFSEIPGQDVEKTPFPTFYVTEVNRDENTNELSITAYDRLVAASATYISDIGLTALDNSIESVVDAIAEYLGCATSPVNTGQIEIQGNVSTIWTSMGTYTGGFNVEGSETLREVLDDAAEVSQSIYYINEYNQLSFKQLDKDGEAVLTIDKEKYFTLDSRTNRRLAAISSVTDLGDNLIATTGVTGTTQYIRNNLFYSLRTDVADLLESAVTSFGGMTINQFDCDWRGNYLLEIGDKIDLVTKDGQTVTSYLLNDTLLFNGALSQHTQWSYADNDIETANNPTNLGTALNETFARVDKLNRTIDLMASEVNAATENVAQLKINTDNITNTVTQVQETVVTNNETLQQEIAELREEVSTKVTKDEYKITISETLTEGVESVSTTTGYTFDKEGLTIEKSGSEMSTMITEDGMTVYRNGDGVLIANNEGVKAEDLHATTYLIIGKYSRFEDYKKGSQKRTGCFWIGG